MLLHIWGGIGFDELTRDPISFLGGSIYTGSLSQVGILIWSAIASICIFSSYSLPKTVHSGQVKNFLFASGLLTSMLGLDDAFLLHEKSSEYLGIAEKIIYLFYFFCICIYVAKFYSLIAATEYVLLEVALACFGMSILLDVVEPQNIDPYIFEDSAKLTGIISLLVYFSRLCITLIHKKHTQKN